MAWKIRSITKATMYDCRFTLFKTRGYYLYHIVHKIWMPSVFHCTSQIHSCILEPSLLIKVLPLCSCSFFEEIKYVRWGVGSGRRQYWVSFYFSDLSVLPEMSPGWIIPAHYFFPDRCNCHSLRFTLVWQLKTCLYHQLTSFSTSLALVSSSINAG